MTTTDARPVGPERGADAQFAHWATVRRCALAAYLAALVAWSAYYGIPIQRELVILWVCGALVCVSLGRQDFSAGASGGAFV